MNIDILSNQIYILVANHYSSAVLFVYKWKKEEIMTRPGAYATLSYIFSSELRGCEVMRLLQHCECSKQCVMRVQIMGVHLSRHQIFIVTPAGPSHRAEERRADGTETTALHHCSLHIYTSQQSSKHQAARNSGPVFSLSTNRSPE